MSAWLSPKWWSLGFSKPSCSRVDLDSKGFAVAGWLVLLETPEASVDALSDSVLRRAMMTANAALGASLESASAARVGQSAVGAHGSVDTA